MNDALAQKFLEDMGKQQDRIMKLTTENLLRLLDDDVGDDLDPDYVMLELFRRGALYQMIERYPEEKQSIIGFYNDWRVISAVVKSNLNAAQY